jgi:hypothetical protein
MSGAQWIVLRLEVERDADPISGILTSDTHEERSFTGWLGLTDAIEEIRAAQAKSAATVEDQD